LALEALDDEVEVDEEMTELERVVDTGVVVAEVELLPVKGSDDRDVMSDSAATFITKDDLSSASGGSEISMRRSSTTCKLASMKNRKWR
jgi:hypothetical protein